MKCANFELHDCKRRCFGQQLKEEKAAVMSIHSYCTVFFPPLMQSNGL